MKHLVRLLIVVLTMTLSISMAGQTNRGVSKPKVASPTTTTKTKKTPSKPSTPKTSHSHRQGQGNANRPRGGYSGYGGGYGREIDTEQEEMQRQREAEERRRQEEARQQELQRQREAEERRQREQLERENKRIIENLVANMVYVEGGTFTMGATKEMPQPNDNDKDEKPKHKVTLSPFYIGRYEVTQAEWRAVMGNNPSQFIGYNRPVENVSWYDCQEFIRKLSILTGKNFRLPTEAEWEYAARGGKKPHGFKYSGSNAIENVGWYNRNGNSSTHTVGTKSPNNLGLYDMSGNVFEWCHDKYGDYRKDSQTNPIGASSGDLKVLRGGSWYSPERQCCLSNRECKNNYYHSDYLGLRLVISEDNLSAKNDQTARDETSQDIKTFTHRESSFIVGATPGPAMFKTTYRYEGGEYRLFYNKYRSFSLAFEDQLFAPGLGFLLEFSYSHASYDHMTTKDIPGIPQYTDYNVKNINDYSLTLYGNLTLLPNHRFQIPIYLGLGGDVLKGEPFHHFMISAAAKLRLKYYVTNSIGIYVGVNARTGMGSSGVEKDSPRKGDTHSMYNVSYDAGVYFSF